jgi:GTPase
MSMMMKKKKKDDDGNVDLEKLNAKYPDVNYANSEISKDDNEKDKLNLVIIGHVDSGKSTLMGHLLVKTGRVDQKTLHKYKKES